MLFTPFLDGYTEALHLPLQQRGSYRKANGSLRQHPHFTIQAYVIAIILHDLTACFENRWGIGTLAFCRGVHFAHEFEMKVDVSRPIAWSVEVGDIRRDELLPGTEQIHVVLQMSGRWIEHAGVNACLLPKVL